MFSRPLVRLCGLPICGPPWVVGVLCGARWRRADSRPSRAAPLGQCWNWSWCWCWCWCYVASGNSGRACCSRLIPLIYAYQWAGLQSSGGLEKDSLSLACSFFHFFFSIDSRCDFGHHGSTYGLAYMMHTSVDVHRQWPESYCVYVVLPCWFMIRRHLCGGGRGGEGE